MSRSDFTSIPIIDFSLSTSPQTKPEFISQLRHALINVGFLYLSNSTVEQSVVDEVKSYLPKFFGLPQEEKDKIRMENSPHYVGYNGLGSEITKGETDFREQFDFLTPHVSRWKPGDPDYYNVWGPSQYPDEQALPGFQKTLETYSAQTWSLVKELIQLVAEALGLPRDAFARFFDTDDKMTSLGKLIRYPPVTENNKSSQGVGPHVDGGFLTILLQASEHPGLQAQNLAGEWVDIPPIPGTFVVNFGRALEFVTDGIIRATSHQVLSPPSTFKTARYSVPFFQMLSLDVRLSDPQNKLKFPNEIIQLRDARGKLVDTEAINFTEFATEPYGKVHLIGRAKSHPDVAAKYYPHLFELYFPNGLPDHYKKLSEVRVN
ncbi:Clavaminate synthase-like protein [Marasmius fiardii PR-910]|nr:Clavaminate synthase-like protein [Marasmius fiardii PR-910]